MKVKLRYLFLVLAILGASCPFYGQTVGFHRLGQVLARAPQGVMAQVVPYAKINVTNSATRLAATIYSDVNLTVPISPPLLTADANGQYDYFVPANYCVNESISSPSQGNQSISNICQGTTFSQAAGLPFQAQYNSNGVLAGSLATFDAAGNLNTPGSVAAGAVIPAGGPYLDITNPVFGGICDGLPHLGGSGSGDLNVDAVLAAMNTWRAGGYTLGNPTGASCIFTKQVGFLATSNIQNPLVIDTRGGTWHSQVTATPLARFWVKNGGGDYVTSGCPTGVTVNGDASIPVTVTCVSQAITVGSNSAPAFASPGNYTTSNWTETAGSMAINFTGANSFSPTAPLTVVAGNTYQVQLTTSSYTSGTISVTLGGVTVSGLTPAVGTPTVVQVLATTTGNLTVSASSGGAQMTFSAINVTNNPNTAPVFASGANYTVSNWTSGSGTMAINCPSGCTNSFSPTTPLAIAASQLYAVTVTTGASWTSGTLNITLGGTTITGVTVPAIGHSTTVFLTTSDSTNLSISASSGGAVMTLASISVQQADLQVTSVKMTTPNQGSAFSGSPTVLMTGGTLYPGVPNGAAGVIAVMSGAFNFTVTNPAGGSITIGGLMFHNSIFQDDGDGAAVLINVDGGPYSRANIGHVTLDHNTFRTETETCTAFQTIGTFESLAQDNRIVYANASANVTSASLGYYGFALLPAQNGVNSSEWKVRNTRTAGFDHGLYMFGGSLIIDGNVLLQSYEEGGWVSSTGVEISANHTENTWNNNSTGGGTGGVRSGFQCQGTCSVFQEDDFTNAGFSNFAVKVFTPTNAQGVIVGGTSLSLGTTGYHYLSAGGNPGTVNYLWGIPTLSGATGSDYVLANSNVVLDSALIKTGNYVNVNQGGSGLQWVQTNLVGGVSSYIALGALDNGANVGEWYARWTGSGNNWHITHFYSDASKISHYQVCSDATNSINTPPTTAPSGCVDVFGWGPSSLASASGLNYTCFNTSGTMVSQATPCTTIPAAITGPLFYSVAGAKSTAMTAPAQNATKLWSFYFSGPTTSGLSTILVNVTTADNSANLYDIGVYGPGCAANATNIPLAEHIGATAGSSINGGVAASVALPLAGAPVSGPTPGWYCLAETSNGATPLLVMGSDSNVRLSQFAAGSSPAGITGTTSGGVLNPTITAPTGPIINGTVTPWVYSY